MVVVSSFDDTTTMRRYCDCERQALRSERLGSLLHGELLG